MVCEFQRLVYPHSTVGLGAGSYMVAMYAPCEKIRDQNGRLMDLVKAVGYGLPLTANLRYKMHGRWTETAKHGMQFEVDTYEEVIFPTKAGIMAYLTSGQITGIGERIAERIYAKFGNKTLDILDNDPKRLMEVEGIGKATLETIINSYLANRAARDTVAFLTPYGITANRAVKLYQEYGSKTIETIKNNPYCLCDLAGIGFITADDIAKKLGMDELAPERADAALIYTLKNAETEGHLCMEKREFVKAALKLLNTNEFTAEMLASRAARLELSGELEGYDGFVYRENTARIETSLAGLVKSRLNCMHGKMYADLDFEIEEEERKLGIRFAEEQKQAVKTALVSGLAIITGGPGTGKTLIQRAILDIYSKNYPTAVVHCCAPTGRAARRMAQATGRPATTAHKLLGLFADDDGNFGEPSEVKADLVLVDEVSMLDVYLANALFKAMQKGTQLILIGDSDQLPSVGPGAVLSELIASEVVPVVRLDKVFRQSAGSRIAINAKLIRHGNMNLEYGDDFLFVDSPDMNESAERIVELYADEVAEHGLDNVVLLSPFRQRTETGVNALNERLQAKINPPERGKEQVEIGKKIFREGDKVMQTQNSSLINNGDVGYIRRIQIFGSSVNVEIDFGDGRTVCYDAEDMKKVDLGYACTIHKSQGSEYETVIISIQTAYFKMLTRPLIYTAITRGKNKVIIVGEHRAKCMAIKKTDVEKRGTCLAKKLKEKIKENRRNYYEVN